MVYGCTWARVRSSVEVSGKIFGTELSHHRDVNIRLAVTWHWTPHMTVRQPYPRILDNAVTAASKVYQRYRLIGSVMPVLLQGT
jgi:hypothetical protein